MFVDVGFGNATFVFTPAEEILLLDTGSVHTADRLLAFMEQNAIPRIDYLVASHFEDDHMGAAFKIAERVPILNYVDHGESAVYGKSDEWWGERRFGFHAGAEKRDTERYDNYVAVRNKARHIPMKVGDRAPIQGLEMLVVSGGGKELTRPLEGAGQPNPHCAGIDQRTEDDAEDGQSMGVVARHGKFRFIYLGDLTWNAANRLFCPRNLIGAVDAYLITHHAQSLPGEMGAYYHGISSCPPSEVFGLAPRVAILSLGPGGHRRGTSEAIQTVHKVPGCDLWQTNYVREGGEAGYNGAQPYIANLGEKSEKIPFLELIARADGSFTMTNSRNGFTKQYPPRAN
ncbi:MAG: MBL fold metallo-hydrolase [Candidatus Sumerlaeota bacterium]|nr:MBL fold metallo-hydrolase [Candidatus Sumerlaeota bacterium]